MKEKKTESSKEINALDVRIQVERSNPLILRDVRVPGDLTAEELLAMAGLVLGIEKTECELVLGDEEITEKKRDAYDLLQMDRDLRVILYSSETSKKNGDTVFLRIWENHEASIKELPDRVPEVIFAVGRNLPRRCVSIGIFNKIQDKLEQGYAACEVEGEHYDEASLAFSQRKTENGLRRYFSPETALPELRRDLTMPLLPLLEKLKMNELKGMADAYGIYYDSTTRKPYLVGAFYKKYDHAYIQHFFEEISFQEFLNFRKFVCGEDPGDKDWEDLLPECFNHGFYTDVSKQGPRIALELLEYYEEWYGTDREEDFLRRKYMQAALKASANLYGVFDRAKFQSMLDIIAPERIGDSSVDTFLQEITVDSLYSDIRQLQTGVFYHKKTGTKSAAEKLWKAMLPIRELYYKPDREEALRLVENKSLLHQDTRNELEKMLYAYGYYSVYYGLDRIEQALEMIQNDLWLEGNEEQAERTALRYMERLRWADSDENKARLKAILQEEAKSIPLVILNGYAEKNAPKELKEFLAVYRAGENNGRTKAEVKTAKKKATVKRAVAVKKRN